MSATAMYPHYRSKEELLYDIALEGHSSLLATLRSADDPSARCAARFRSVVAAFATWHAENNKQARVVQYELHGLSPARFRIIAPLRRQVTELIANIVDSGVKAGEFDVDNLDDVVMAVSSLCVDVCRWFPSRRHGHPRALGETCARVAERLLG